MADLRRRILQNKGYLIIMTRKTVTNTSTDNASGGSPDHSFRIGQAVRLKNVFGGKSTSGLTYRVTGRLPARDGLPQYRIQSDGEAYERMTTQDQLEAVSAAAPGSNSALLEKTFGSSRR
ncbi:hypothetical protein SIAM614_04970 [Roseibium aggregatum IAM 12614]|jgi:hypothetical protein|uniref:Uncharacterized protein n=2 Tax=Stappiaceae TaxID=2821832 RepID=A0NSF7_ROSAI|nr:hypothetical protein SIAM614_04970 [Roseibium aggregatum IAM 12614]